MIVCWKLDLCTGTQHLSLAVCSLETASFTSHIRCMCDVLSERGDECCAVTGVSKLSFVCLTDLTIASASSGASMDARYHLGASGIF